MNKVKISNGCFGVEARYTEQIIQDYKSNPLIEALPNILSMSETIEKLAIYPECHNSEREAESHYRIHMLDRLFQVFQPLPMALELESKISRAIRQGYVSRNPFDNKLAKEFYKDYYSSNLIGARDKEGFLSSSLGFTLIGISGLGKTSTLQRILSLYPSVIVHSEYKGIPLSMYQVVYLKLECPHDGSIKGLLYEFFTEVDRLLGTNYLEKVIKSKPTIDTMITMMNQVIRNCSLGILIIDEIQHLSMAKSGGSEKMLNFFVNLVNVVNVPVILVGTPKAISVLQGDFRQARRGSGSGGDMVCDRIQKGHVWDLLLNSIWRYQWTRKETPLNQELSDIMYEETQGIPDLVKKVYAIAQAYAINTGKEEVTTNIIKKVVKDNLKLVQPMITALKTNNLREIARYDDINLMDINIQDTLTRTKKSINLDLRAKEMIRNKDEIKQNNIIGEKKEFSERNLKQESINDIKESDVTVKKRGKHITIPRDISDMRLIIEKEKDSNKSVYEILKETGYIINFDRDIFSKGVVK